MTSYAIGPQERITWCAGMSVYLERCCADQVLLLMLDDYGLCAPADRARIKYAQQRMLADPTIGNVHLTWQPTPSKTPRDDGLLGLSPWDYSINTQAALWRRDLLLAALHARQNCTIEDFELAGSRWFNSTRHTRDAHCQAAIREPANPSGFVDETDKTDWPLAYHNLMRRGRADPRHAAFLLAHVLRLGDTSS